MTYGWGAGVLCPAVLLVAMGQRAATPSVKLIPETIQMGALYKGARLHIEGTVQAGSKAVVAIRGAEVNEVLNFKKRVGPIFVNSGKVQVFGIPSLLFCFAPEPVADFLRRDEIDQHLLDEAAFSRRMRIAPPEMDNQIVRANYVILTRREGRFRIVDDGVRMDGLEAGRAHYSVDCLWPKAAPAASYEVLVYECRGGSVVGRCCVPLRVAEVGLPAELVAAANKHGVFFGVVAVLVALLCGLGMDLLIRWVRRPAVRQAP